MYLLHYNMYIKVSLLLYYNICTQAYLLHYNTSLQCSYNVTTGVLKRTYHITMLDYNVL